MKELSGDQVITDGKSRVVVGLTTVGERLMVGESRSVSVEEVQTASIV